MNLQSTTTTPEVNVVTNSRSHTRATHIRATTLLAWSSWAIVIACATVSLILRIQNTAPLFSTYKGGGAGLLSEILYWEILIPLATPAYATVGAIVASRRPTNAVGWICLIGGLIIGLQDVSWQSLPCSSPCAIASSASLRHEVDLNQLNEQLVAIVQETMQPAHVSLWLRSSSRDGTQNTQV